MQDRLLGDFRLEQTLGEGGFGTVYRAEQRGLGRPAVVKVIRPALTARRDAVERFALEARLASRFDHPYAAHVYAFGVEPDGVMWIAMELVKGTPLDELIKRSGPLPLDRLVPLLERLCDVVQSAHDQGIIHRDIKPSNVMVIARAGRLMPKLLDFGIAKLVAAAEPPAAEPRASPASCPTLPSGPEPAPGQLLDHTLAISTVAVAASGSLTREGQVLGSPVYMAPEQWLDATNAGPHADQYALGLLAYEAVTGMRAFDGTSLEALAEQHLRAELPALPPQLPAALYDVLARATAKQPERRYAHLGELAAALRHATGIGSPDDHDERIATLPAALRAEWLGDAPQPIADSIAALVAAWTWVRAEERIAALGGLLARWLGVLALACRSKLGKLDATASFETELVLALRRRPLLDGEWLDLAVCLARPFRARPEAWPVPEMAKLLADSDGVAELRALLRSDRPDATDERIARRAHLRRISQVEAVLARLGWLLDYSIAREVPGGLELWMGQRSDERVVQDTVSDGSGSVVLIDAYGERIARLSPLIQLAPAIPGDPDDLFVFAGPGRDDSTARFVAYPRGFERDSDDVWSWLASHILETAPLSPSDHEDPAAPYPGLAAYTALDRDAFVGRERDVEELLNRLRSHPAVTLVGPSGIGKTSFLAAGVVPALGASWHAEIIRPGSDPLATLAAIAGRLDVPPYRDGHQPGARPEPVAVAQALAGLAERRGIHLVVIVDQAEELFTMCDDDARTRFATALAAATASPRLRAVIALRDDFLCRAAELAAWGGLVGRSVQVLRVPGRDDLERMIALPARRRGFDFDDPALPAMIAAEVVDRPGALPLVAFTAAKLWEHRDRHFRRLTRAAYDQIGGVTGALVNHADGVVDRMTAPDRRLVRLAFRRLLTSDGTRALIGRAELTATLGGTPAAAAVIERLLAARLIVSHDDDSGDRIEVIHESLVTTWPRLAGWRREDDAGTRLHERLAVAARHWSERGRPADLLWRGNAVTDFVRWQDTEPRAVTELEDAFVRASLAAGARGRRRRAGLVAGGFAVLIAGSLGLIIANHEIANQRSAAVERLAVSFEERGRLAIGDGDDARAMLYLAEAARLGAHGPGFDVLTSHAAGALDAGVAVVAHGTAAIRMLAPAPDGFLTVGEDLSLTWWDAAGHARPLARNVHWAALVGDLAVAITGTGDVTAIDRSGRTRWLASGAVTEPDGDCVVASAPAGLAVTLCDKVLLWDVATGQPRGALAHPAAVRRAAFDASGARLATADISGVVRIWNVPTSTLVASCEPHTDRVRALVFSPDGKTVVSGGNDRDVRLCDAATGAALHRLVGHSHEVLAVDVSPDGQTILSASRDGKPRLWNARTGVLETTLEGHRGTVRDARFSPDGSRIVTLGTDDLTARLWNREGMPLGSLQGHGSRLSAALWEPDGRHLLTAAFDGAIRRWDADLAVKASPQHTHAAAIRDLAISADERWVLTASDDATAALWDRATNQIAARLHHAGQVEAIAFAPDGATALTVQGGSVQTWRIPGGERIAKLATSASAAAYAGETLVTADDREVTFWSRTGDKLGSAPLGYHPDRLVVDPSGRWVFAPGTTREVAVFDATTRSAAARLAIHSGYAADLASSATRVAIADGTSIRLWLLATWAQAGELTGHKSRVSDLRYLADGRLVSIADDGARVWNPDGRVLGALGDGPRIGAAVGPSDSSIIATTSTDGAVRIWDATTYHRLLQLPGHRLPAYVIQMTRDGRFAISAGFDGRVVAWDLGRRTRSAGELAAIARCRVPLRLEGDTALPRDLDFDDPSCHSPSQPVAVTHPAQ